MKKHILVVCLVLVTCSITAIGMIGWSATPVQSEQKEVKQTPTCNSSYAQPEIDLYYHVAPRFNHRVTKEDLSNVKSIMDIYPENATNDHQSFHNVKVAILSDGKEIVENGENEFLTDAQKDLLSKLDYSTNFYVHADCKRKNSYTGLWEDNYIVYYITVVPEKQAEYVNGQEALIQYLKEKSARYTGVIERKHLQPGKVSFTVTKTGEIDGVKLTSTSGYQSVDQKLIGIIKELPGEWDSATNSKGEKVDQELVFYFGLQGC